MPYVEDIVCLINSHYKDAVFTGAPYAISSFYGITQPVTRRSEDKTDIVPAVMSGDEFKYVGPDDDTNLIIYHKLNGNAYSNISGTGYGRSQGFEKCVSDCSMVVFGMRFKLGVSQHQLEQKVNQNLIEKITKAKLVELKLNTVNINAVSSNMDAAQVFSNEFKNVPYFLSEKHILFELKYTIEAIYNKGCFTNC